MINKVVLKPKFPFALFLSTSVAFAAGAATLYSLSHFQSTAQIPLEIPKSEPKITVNTVAAIGYLEPEDEVIKVSAPAFAEGARVAQLEVKRGDRVEVGQVIAVLDSRDRLQAALQRSKTQVQVAQARLDQVKAGAKQGAINAQSAEIERLNAELEGQMIAQRAKIASLQAQFQGEKQSQEATIKRLKAQLTGETQAQEATIDRLKAQLNNAQRECQRYQELYQEGAVSTSQRDRICLDEAIVREQLNEAEANLVRIGNTQAAQINEAQATLNRIVLTISEQINEAKANLERTILTLEKQKIQATATREEVAEVRPVDVAVAEAELSTAKASVQQAQADLDLAFVRSPRSGQVLKINTWPGEIVSNQGIIEMGQTNQMYVTAEVYETDIYHVRLGQSVRILSDGVIGELQGTVNEIGLQIGKKDILGTDPVKDADARVIEVKIRLTPEDSQRVSGLTNLQVTVLINTSELKN